MCGSSKATKVDIDKATQTARVEFNDGWNDSRYGFGVLDLSEPGKPRLVDSGAYDESENTWNPRAEPSYVGKYGTYFAARFGSALIEAGKFPALDLAIREGLREVEPYMAVA